MLNYFALHFLNIVYITGAYLRDVGLCFRICFTFLLLTILPFVAICAHATTTAAVPWQHSIALGYGFGKEIEQNYHNHGIVLSGKFYRFPNIDEKLVATLDATLAYITATTNTHSRIVTAAAALAMRAYFFDPKKSKVVRPYLQASFGPAFLSQKELGNRSQGSHFAFQTTMEVGTEFEIDHRQFDLNVRIIHYCNAGIFHPNQGINLATVVSIGYLF